MSKICFTEVDEVDVSTIRSFFPDSICVKGTLQQEIHALETSAIEALCVFIYSTMTKEYLDQFPNLKIICTRSVGYDHIDMLECEKRGIIVCNVPDYGSHVIAEHVFALLLSTIRHIPAGDVRTQAGVFDYRGLRGISLHGKTIAIIGTGKIGACVAKIAYGFGMHCIGVDQCRNTAIEREYGVQYKEISEAITEADIISLHLPATPSTRHMLNTERFSAMKPGVIIINTARGSLIDSKALLDALQVNIVQYALLDVLEDEQNYSYNQQLLEHSHVIVTPHIAFYADDSMRKMYEVSLASLQDWVAGNDLLHRVMLTPVVCDLPRIA